MSKILLREQVIKLRLKGYTYGQIKRNLEVSKSTLSEWLKELPLSETQQNLLSRNRLISRDLAREKYIQTRKNQRIARLKMVLEKQTQDLLPLSERELLVAGLFLYWGEGTKQHGLVSISNTNPQVIRFALFWMTEILKVSIERIRIALQLYKDMDVDQELDFWSIRLKIPRTQFRNPYIKKTNREGLTYKSFGHGTCNLYISNVELSEKIAMSIKTISEFYGEKNETFWYN